MKHKSSEQDNLGLIVSMIENSRANIRTSGIGRHFLFNGYLVLIAGLTQFIFWGGKWASLGWIVMIPVSIVGNIIISRTNRRNAKVYTYTDRIVGNTWLAFGICMLIALAPAYDLIPIPQGGFFYFYPTMLMVTAFALFASGMAYRFKPLIVGAIVCWLFSIACFYVSYRWDILLYCIAFLVSYIIPGHMICHKKSGDV